MFDNHTGRNLFQKRKRFQFVKRGNIPKCNVAVTHAYIKGNKQFLFFTIALCSNMQNVIKYKLRKVLMRASGYTSKGEPQLFIKMKMTDDIKPCKRITGWLFPFDIVKVL